MVTRSTSVANTRSRSKKKPQPASSETPTTTTGRVSKPRTTVREEEYEVERIIAMRGSKKRKYLVAWVGYAERTWEPPEHLPADMVAAYLSSQALPLGATDTAPVNLSENTDQALAPTHGDSSADGGESTNCNDAADAGGLTVATSVGVARHDFDGSLRREPLAVTGDTAALFDAGREDEDDVVSDNADVYEVESIVGMKTISAGGVDTPMFLVAWEGYTEQTWEPADNLPNDVVAEYLRSVPPLPHADEATSGRDGGRDDGAQYATCGDGPDGLGSACARCKRPMHHFCASDVCQTLGLKDANGVEMVEFPNDTCFCSAACYNRRVGAVREAKRKRVRANPASSDSAYEDGDDDEDDTGLTKSKRKVPRLAKSSVSNAKKPKNTVVQGVKTTITRKKTSTNAEEPEMWPPRKPKTVNAKPQPTVTTADRHPLVGKMVAFCADKEDWMSSKLYREAKGLFISGRVHLAKRVIGERHTDDVYEVRWTVTNYQSKKYFHRLTRAKVEEGIGNHTTLCGGSLNNASWKHICQVPESEAWADGKNLDDYVILDGTSDLFVSQQVQPANLELVEQISNLDFQPHKRMQEPPDLFTHDDGTVGTKLIKEKRHYFETASSSFFAYLPLSYWNTVVNESNAYAEQSSKGKSITLEEMMRFFGILFFMTIVDKGEYSNYWGDQVEDAILGLPSSGSGLDTVMTLKRFQYIRMNLCFRCNVSPVEMKKDPAARIRPLINMLKYTSTKYVIVGRDVAVDESSIACRSKFGRHLIVYNASKPTGKFHFKIYACCCATTWLMVGFRLHCASDMKERLDGVVSSEDSTYLEDRIQFSSSVRQIVLEVTRPLHNSNRIVNTDNFYSSVTLLLSLRDVGMYGRGTIRESSAHFPKAHMFAKKAKEPRGSSLQGVSNTGQMVAASWMDGSAVNIISNADASDMGEVTRLIGKNHVAFPAPRCIAEYNKHMQGVDRLDQLRAKYSIADGHSMQKWHKKLGLAFIDVARVNAYVTRCLRLKMDGADRKTQRNQHRQFMVELASELISGKWKDSVVDEGMLFADDQLSTASMSTAGSPRVPSPSRAPCSFEHSSIRFPNATRGKRGCKVCAFEGRPWTMKSLYCIQHNVCLCTNTYPGNEMLEEVLCKETDWSCWRKYHEFYLPRGVFNAHGRIMRSSKIFIARRRLELESVDVTAPTPAIPPSGGILSPEVGVYSPLPPTADGTGLTTTSEFPESPPTLIFSPFNGSPLDAEQSRVPLPSPAFEAYPSPTEIQSVTASSDFEGSFSVQV